MKKGLLFLLASAFCLVVNAVTPIHVNWGWNGKANGYFLDGVFSITNELEYDYALSFSGSYNFKYNLAYTAIYH